MCLRTCTQTKIRTLWNVTLLGAWLWDVSFNNANNVQIRTYVQWEFQSFFSSQKDVCSAGKQGHSSLRFKQNIYLPLLPQFGQNYQISQALSACLSSRYWIIYFKFAHFDQSCETLRSTTDAVEIQIHRMTYKSCHSSHLPLWVTQQAVYVTSAWNSSEVHSLCRSLPRNTQKHTHPNRLSSQFVITLSWSKDIFHSLLCTFWGQLKNPWHAHLNIQ